MASILCKERGKQISYTAKSHPHFEAKVYFSKFFKITLFIILAILAKPANSQNKETAIAKKTDEWSGKYLGRDKCSMGRNKNQWSNQYEIEISQSGSEFKLLGIYFQSRQTIRCKLIDGVLTIPEQTIGDSSFIIRGKGTINGNKLTIDYEVDVIVNFEPKQYETNRCSAEFEKQ